MNAIDLTCACSREACSVKADVKLNESTETFDSKVWERGSVCVAESTRVIISEEAGTKKLLELSPSNRRLFDIGVSTGVIEKVDPSAGVDVVDASICRCVNGVA